MYSIKDAATKLNCKTNAIRFYEKKELLVFKRDKNGYRILDDNDIQILQFILLYRKLGFSVDAIRIICINDCNNKLGIYINQYSMINKQIHEMMKIRDVMGKVVDDLLESNQISNDVSIQLDSTINLISDIQNWKDKWDFDNWATNYDQDIKTETQGLDFYKNYDLIIDTTAKEVTLCKGDIVEIGIGTGNLTKCIIDNYLGNVIYGIDQSINMMKKAKLKLLNIPMRLGNFLSISLEDNVCDCVVSSYAFHHCNSKEKILAIKEMGRILKPYGRIIITDLMFYDDKAKKDYAKGWNVRQLKDLNDEYFANIDALKTIFDQQGYSMDFKQIDELIFMVVATKL